VQKQQQKIAEIRQKHEELKKLLPQLKKNKASSDPKMPKTVDACEAAIAKEAKKIDLEE
jgi:predicted transcriptional regulator